METINVDTILRLKLKFSRSRIFDILCLLNRFKLFPNYIFFFPYGSSTVYFLPLGKTFHLYFLELAIIMDNIFYVKLNTVCPGTEKRDDKLVLAISL